jgi:putative tryptophan/tyrosine transport system substrate-binding protein
LRSRQGTAANENSPYRLFGRKQQCYYLKCSRVRQALRELGYIEGKNVSLEARSSEGKNERFPALVAELIQLKVDVLVSTNTAAIRAAKKVTNAIPIIMVTNQDPVATGFINSLAHPGGNVTGVTTLTRDLTGKRLELFKELVPKMSCVGIFLDANLTLVRVAWMEYLSPRKLMSLC